MGGRFKHHPLILRNTSAAAKAIRLFPSMLVPVDEWVIDRQAFHQRSGLGHDVVVVASLRAKKRGLQRS
jgi:hypothetical protein